MQMLHPPHSHRSESVDPRVVKPTHWFFWTTLFLLVSAYFFHLLGVSTGSQRTDAWIAEVYRLVQTVWWGVGLGVLAVGFLQLVPQVMVLLSFRAGPRWLSVFRATLAGSLLDLSRQSVLLLAMSLYKRGASLGQTVGFLIATPWNSVSLSLILYILVGGEILFRFLVLSMVVAWVAAILVDELIDRGIFKGRSHSELRAHAPPQLQIPFSWKAAYFIDVVKLGFRESKVTLQWVFLGVLVSSACNVFLTAELLQNVFGASAHGLSAALGVGLGIELIGEAPLPLVENFVMVAQAPGSAFAFLMASAIVDIPTMAALREQTQSWKTVFGISLIVLVLVLTLSTLLNMNMLNF